MCRSQMQTMPQSFSTSRDASSQLGHEFPHCVPNTYAAVIIPFSTAPRQPRGVSFWWHRLQPVLFLFPSVQMALSVGGTANLGCAFFPLLQISKLKSRETSMSLLNPKDRVSLCLFPFEDGRRCRTSRIASHPHFCYYHAQKETRAQTTQKTRQRSSLLLLRRLSFRLRSQHRPGRLILATIRGDIKTKTIPHRRLHVRNPPAIHPRLPRRIHQRFQHRRLAQSRAPPVQKTGGGTTGEGIAHFVGQPVLAVSCSINKPIARRKPTVSDFG
jgi:hypothetical protein